MLSILHVLLLLAVGGLKLSSRFTVWYENNIGGGGDSMVITFGVIISGHEDLQVSWRGINKWA